MSARTILKTNRHNLRQFVAYENGIYANDKTKTRRTTATTKDKKQPHQYSDSSSNIKSSSSSNNEHTISSRSSRRSNKSLKLLRNRTIAITTTTTTTTTTKTAEAKTNDIIKRQRQQQQQNYQHQQQQQHYYNKRQDNRLGNSAALPAAAAGGATSCCSQSSNFAPTAVNFPAFMATSSSPSKWHKQASLLSAFLLNSTLLVLAANTTATMVDGLTAADVADINISNNNNNNNNNNNFTKLRYSASNISSGSLNCSADFASSLGCLSSSGADTGGLIAGSGSFGTANVNTGDISFNDTDLLSSEQASEYIFDRMYVRVIFITLYTMVFCCCFFGNLLVILVVTMSRRLRSITNFFLANLALADFCVGLFCVMQNLSIYLIDSWVFGEFLCRMYQFVHSLSYTASIFILVVICMERYFAIVHPITCKQILTAARLRMAILTVWITSAVYSTPKFVFSKTIKNIHTEDGQEEEICVLDRKMFNSKLLDMINFGLLYVIPLLVMMVLYSKIAIALWRSSRGLSHHIASHSQQQQQQANNLAMHNSMYHHHHGHAHAHGHGTAAAIQNHSQLQQQQQAPGTPISGSSGVGGGLLSRRQSSKYEKRGVSITESQHDNCKVSLDADRPIVSACRKTSFYHNSHQQQTQAARVHGGMQRNVAHNVSHSSNNVLRARRGVVRMLIIFVLTFALCNLPYHARKMWQYWSRSYRGDSNFNALLTPLTFLVSYFNSGVNPLLYAFLSRNFRKGMKELLLCSWKKGKGKSSSNSSMHHKRMALQTHSLPTDTTHIGNEQL